MEKVKKVKTGRRRREGWRVKILKELLLMLRVEKMARIYCGANRMEIDTRRSIETVS